MNNASETILIVDDQEENRRIVNKVLSMMGYKTLIAVSAQDALDILAREVPDLILLDVMMPEVDGISACQQIKADHRLAAIPIIFLSAADDKNLIVKALEVGGVDFVTKPFNRAELVSRVRTQLALKHSNDQLRMLAEDKDEILGILAHDLKNSLAGMKLSAGLLRARRAELPPRCALLVDNIMHATERMLSFMKEFLANQRSEQLHLKKESVNLNDALRALTVIHQPAATAKELTLTSYLPDMEVVVEADREGVKQVFDNVVSNAIKFSPSGGSVSIHVDPPAEGRVRCIVKDTGPGFTEEDRKQMFRRYGRLSAQPTGDEPSTGLGLSIVKRLIDGMGGTIELAEPGQADDSNAGARPGAEFIIILPLPAAQNGSP